MDLDLYFSHSCVRQCLSEFGKNALSFNVSEGENIPILIHCNLESIIDGKESVSLPTTVKNQFMPLVEPIFLPLTSIHLHLVKYF
jgi:hypothetical protein